MQCMQCEIGTDYLKPITCGETIPFYRQRVILLLCVLSLLLKSKQQVLSTMVYEFNDTHFAITAIIFCTCGILNALTLLASLTKQTTNLYEVNLSRVKRKVPRKHSWNGEILHFIGS